MRHHLTGIHRWYYLGKILVEKVFHKWRTEATEKREKVKQATEFTTSFLLLLRRNCVFAAGWSGSRHPAVSRPGYGFLPLLSQPRLCSAIHPSARQSQPQRSTLRLSLPEATEQTKKKTLNEHRSSPAFQWHYIQSFAVILAKKFASTIFAGGFLWLGALFFLPLFVRNFCFQSAHLRDASSQALLKIHHKKMPSSCPQTSGHDSSLHDELRHWLPVISSPNFFFCQLWRQNAPLQTAMDKMHTMDSLLWATDTEERKKKGSQNLHPAPKMRAKIKKNTNMRSRCRPDREQEGKDTFFFEFGSRFLDRWCSSGLVLFPSAIYSCQGDLATCFTCLHQSKASQKSPRGVANLGLQTCMQPDVLQHASLQQLHVDLRKPQGL